MLTCVDLNNRVVRAKFGHGSNIEEAAVGHGGGERCGAAVCSGKIG